MNTKHTPGPYWMSASVDPCACYAIGAGNREIGMAYSRADALLFKAAPDLLVELESIAAVSADPIVKRMANAAILKARGA